MDKRKVDGLTPSERYLSKLCRHSFLSLWSYSNLYTDRGRTNGKGSGDELCDLLVVFGNDIILFSDKHVQFNESIDTSLAWKRWLKNAVFKSADQLYGAERWLRKYKNRVYLDPQCQTPFPIELPAADKIRIHRIAVARGIYDACQKYFGDNSLGSLLINSDLIGEKHYEKPFSIGHVNPSKGFVHVFEDFTLDAVFSELDTVADFIAYLSKREQFLSKKKPVVNAAGDEQLLAIYLTKLNLDGEHDFVLPTQGEPDFVSLDETFWQSMILNPQYIAKKQADEISYAWDELIEHLIKYGRGFEFEDEGQIKDDELEQALRYMASETRLRRRQLGEAFVHFFEKEVKGDRAVRIVYSNNFAEKAYVFLLLPLKERNYLEYRKFRRAALIACCKITKLVCPKANYIIGFATEGGMQGSSEDLFVLDARDWTSERQEEAESIRKKSGLLLESNFKISDDSIKEWPDVTFKPKAHSHGGLNRKQRRALRNKQRRK